MGLGRRDFLRTGTGVAATLVATGPVLAQQNATPPSSQVAPVANLASQSGELPNNEKRINIVTLRDLETQAQKVMAPFGSPVETSRR